MTEFGERIYEDAYALGRANARVIELARRHCLNMTFTEASGRGLAELQSGLPINARQISCSVAVDNSWSSNLEWLAEDFYKEHCVGCQMRRPTGEVPTLASVVGDREAVAAAAREAARGAVSEDHQHWQQRAEHRRAAAATADPAMAAAIDDLGVLDREPGTGEDPAAAREVLGRLSALADRAPERFSPAVIDMVIQLIEDAEITVLLGPLRHLARRRAELGTRVLTVAFTLLDTGPVVEAGRCVADLIGAAADTASISSEAVRSLIMLAGAPEDEPPISRYRNAVARDPSGLRAVADLAPEVVGRALRAMLPPAVRRSALIVPPGTGRPDRRPVVSDLDRISAANAAQGLATTHSEIAAELADALIGNLGVDPADPYDGQPLASVQHALAAMVVMLVGNAGERIEQAARNASSELRDRLFGVLQAAARLLDPDDRWRTPGDPRTDDDHRRAIFDQLATASLSRTAGDWGDRTRLTAAELLSYMARIDPRWALAHVTSCLGSFLNIIGQLDTPPAAPLIVAGGPPPLERAAQASLRRTSISSAARHLLDTVGSAAAAGPLTVVRGVNDLIADERDTDRGLEVVRLLLPLLGRVGQSYGTERGVLAEILPVLHTYMVDREPALRSAALRAWAAIGADHDLPSSVADLLPALLEDSKVVVARAVLAAACSLDWSDADRDQLFAFAYCLCLTTDAESHGPLLKESMAAVDDLADGERLEAAAEALILRRAADLDRYDLRDVLERGWSSAAAHSPEMAALRLRQARDPEINDRFNYHGDKQLCVLLNCGPGLTALPTDDLIGAAAELAPGSLIGCAEYAEVAWRAGRPADAAAIMRAVAQAIPDQPAYDSHRALTQLLTDAAEFDAASEDATSLGEAGRKLAASTAADSADGYAASLAQQVRARATARFLLAGQEPPAGLALSAATAESQAPGPAAASRLRADRLAGTAAELETLSQRATITAAYTRLFAGLCTIAAHLLRYDAAELDADTTKAAAHMTAARRRAGLLEADLAAQFTPADPLATGLRSALTPVRDFDGEEIAALLASWAALPLPLLIVNGPRPRRSAVNPVLADDRVTTGEQPVAVVLASLDGQLITGPQVLRPVTVYELGLEVRPGTWPEWASRLDAELISHLTAQEAETPTFSWLRPATSEPDHALTGTGTLILRFGLPAGRPAPPFRIALRWHGTRDGEPAAEPVSVAGHRELRFRPYDASRDYLTSQPAFDERLLALYEQLHGAGYNEDQLQAFCRLFTAICRAGLRIMYDPRYKRGARVREKEFHDDLYSRLLAEPELDGRLERGSKLALGFLDVRHDGITAELKVERATPVSEATAPKYMGQPTQYAAADGARLSILAVLDMSPKTSPVGVPENYMFTLQPALHGLTNPEAPSLVAAIVINANSPVPSTWSRRKTAIQDASDQTATNQSVTD